MKEKSMILAEHYDLAMKTANLLESLSPRVEWHDEYCQMADNVRHMADCLKIAPESYKSPSPKELETYWHAECDRCGWHGSSRLLFGGHAIADTGDYDDPYCPVCGNKEV